MTYFDLPNKLLKKKEVDEIDIFYGTTQLNLILLQCHGESNGLEDDKVDLLLSETGEPLNLIDSKHKTGTGSQGGMEGSRSPGARLSHYINKLTELQTQAQHFDKNYPKMKSSPPASQPHSNLVRGLDLTIRSQEIHTPTYNTDRKYTPCLYCCKLKNRTRSGWRVNTFYKCQQCDVPLCVNDRNCFALYHKFFLGIHEVGRPVRQRNKDGRHSSGH